MYFIKEYDGNFERNQENNKEADDYKEYTANGYKGFSYTDSNGLTLHTKILLESDEDEGLSLYMYIEKADYSQDTNLTDVVYGDVFQNFLNTINFE